MQIRPKELDVVHAMVGTAGHVDHGKTSLVMNLTGCDTDQLPEEKQRGLSIDLGFAPCTLTEKRLIGIVDVPGHKDFIRNMVAGAASIDLLLLVVAADDSIMPQTEEHMQIVKLLRTPRVMVVVTKIDLVEPGLLAVVREDVSRFMARMGFPDAPVVLYSSKTLEGIDQLRDRLEAMVEEVVTEARQRPERARAFRMNVEGVFTAKGHGAVVSGIPISGEVRVGDTLVLLPSGQPVAVRAIEVYKREAEVASAGACTALNLRGVPVDALARGMTVAAPGVYTPTTSLVGQLHNVTDATLIKARHKVKLHWGTAVVPASLRLLEIDELPPGAQGFAQITLDAPLALAAGDRFVVRHLSPPATLGGGLVLGTDVGKLRRKAPWLAEALPRSLAAAQGGDLFGAELALCDKPVLDRAALVRLGQGVGDAGIAAKEAAGELLRLPDAWLSRARLPDLAVRVKHTLTRYHAENPYAHGMSPTHVGTLLGLGAKSFTALAEALSAVDADLVVRHGFLALRPFRPALNDRQMRQKAAITERVSQAGITLIAENNLKKELQLSDEDAKLLLKLLAAEGTVCMIDKYAAAATVVAECRAALLALFKSQSTVGIEAFQKATGAGRQVAVALLEAFDVEGLTRRVAEGRVLARAEKG